jgi:hypothetical protein
MISPKFTPLSTIGSLLFLLPIALMSNINVALSAVVGGSFKFEVQGTPVKATFDTSPKENFPNGSITFMANFPGNGSFPGSGQQPGEQMITDVMFKDPTDCCTIQSIQFLFSSGFGFVDFSKGKISDIPGTHPISNLTKYTIDSDGNQVQCPEPASTGAFLFLGILGTSSVLMRKIKFTSPNFSR